MPLYRVRDGQELGHNDGQGNRTLRGGDTVDLPVHVGEELSGKLEPIDKDGKSLATASALERALASAQPHEYDDIRAMFDGVKPEPKDEAKDEPPKDAPKDKPTRGKKDEQPTAPDGTTPSDVATHPDPHVVAVPTRGDAATKP